MIQYETNEFGQVKNIVLYSVSDLAKSLNLKIGKRYAGRNTMFKILKFNKVLTKENQPNQVLINLGIMVFHGCRKHGRLYYMPVFTENGLSYIKQRFAAGKYFIPVQYDVKPKKIKQIGVNINDVC
jgi:hypothetical protein